MVEKTVTISVTLTTAYSDGSTSNETGTGTISFDSLNVPFKQRLKLESELFKHLSTVANNRLQNRLSKSLNKAPMQSPVVSLIIEEYQDTPH